MTDQSQDILDFRKPRRLGEPRTLSSVTRGTRLRIVLLLNLVLVAGLVAVGIAAHSLAVLAAGGDYVADAAAIWVSLFAIALSKRPPTVRRPLGYPKATAIAALVNGSLLLLVVALVFVEGLRRLIEGAGHVHGIPVVVASGIAAFVMVIGTLILRGDVHEEDDDDGDKANMRAVLLDTVADAAAAGGAALVGVVIAITGSLYWLDPAVALIIATIVGYHVVVLLVGVVATLRRPVGTP